MAKSLLSWHGRNRHHRKTALSACSKEAVRIAPANNIDKRIHVISSLGTKVNVI